MRVSIAFLFLCVKKGSHLKQLEERSKTMGILQYCGFSFVLMAVISYLVVGIIVMTDKIMSKKNKK